MNKHSEITSISKKEFFLTTLRFEFEIDIPANFFTFMFQPLNFFIVFHTC